MNKLGSNIYVLPREEENYFNIDRPMERERKALSSQLHSSLLDSSRVTSGLKREIQYMKEKYENSLKEISSLKSRLELQPGNLEEMLNTNRDEYERRIKTYTTKIEQLETKNKTLSTSIQELRSNINAAELGEKEAIRKLRESEKKISSDSANIFRDYQRKLEESQKDFSNRERNITDNFLGEIHELQKENDRLQVLISQNRDKQQDVSLYENKIVENEKLHQIKVQQLETDLKNSNRKYQDKVNELRTAQNQIVANEKLVSSAKSDLAAQKRQIDEFYREKDRLISQLHLKEVALSTLQNNFDEMVSRKMRDDDNNNQLNEEIALLQDKTIKYKQDILRLESELSTSKSNLQGDDRVTRDKIREQERVINERETKLNTVQRQLEKMKREYMEKDIELNSMNKELVASRSTISKLQIELKELNLHTNSLIGENTTNIAKMGEYLTEIAEKTNIIQQLKKELADENTTNRQELLVKINEYQERINDLQTNQTRGQQDLNQKIAEINILKTKIEKQNKLEEELQTYKTKLKTNSDVVNSLESQLYVLKRDNEGLQNQTRQLIENQSLTEKEKNEVLTLYQNVVADCNSLKVQNDSLTSSNTILTSTVNNLYEQINYINFSAVEKDTMYNQLQNLHVQVQEQHTIVNLQLEKDKAIMKVEEDIMQKLQNSSDLIGSAFDAYLIITDAHIVNARQFVVKYVEPFLAFVGGFEQNKAVLENFSFHKKNTISTIKNIISAIVNKVTWKKSEIREHSFFEQQTTAQTNNYMTQYSSLLTLLKVFNENRITFPNFKEVENAHLAVFARVATFTEDIKSQQNKVTTQLAKKALNIISQQNIRLGEAIERMENLIKLNAELLQYYETTILQVIASFPTVDICKNRKLTFDHGSLIQFCSPSINKIGLLGCELLMYVKNLCIEIEDRSYGNNRNELRLIPDVLLMCSNTLTDLLSNNLINRTSPISYLYDLRNIFARTLVHAMQKWTDPFFRLTRDPLETVVMEIFFNTFSQPNSKNVSLPPILLNKTTVYFDNEAKELMFDQIKESASSISRDVLFYFIATLIERLIIKIEHFALRRIFIQDLDTKSYLHNLAQELKAHFSDYDLSINMTEQDIHMFIKFRELFEHFLASMIHHDIEDKENIDGEAVIDTKNTRIMPFITKATEKEYKPRGYLDGPREVVHKIINKTREKALVITKKAQVAIKNTPVPNLSTIYYEWKEKGQKAVTKVADIGRTIGKKAKEKFQNIKKWFTNLTTNKKLQSAADKISVVDSKPHDVFEQADVVRNLSKYVEEEEEEYHINLVPQEELEKRVSVGLKYEVEEYKDKESSDEKLGRPLLTADFLRELAAKKDRLIFTREIDIEPMNFNKMEYKNMKLEPLSKRFEMVRENRVKPSVEIHPNIPIGIPFYESGIEVHRLLDMSIAAVAA